MSAKHQFVLIQVILDMNGMYILLYSHDADAVWLPENLSTKETKKEERKKKRFTVNQNVCIEVFVVKSFISKRIGDGILHLEVAVV